MSGELSDSELIEKYLGEGTATSEGAFGELVGRYVDLVYSACLRQLRDVHDAQDACQAVFIVLARRAGTIRDRQVLGPWLLTVARFAAKDLRERKGAGRARELAAAAMRPEEVEEGVDTKELMGVVDEARGKLGERDQALIVMRYLEGRSVREAAGVLGISENAAALRSSRALERLRRVIGKQGVEVGLSALPMVLLGEGIKTAPAVVAATSAMGVSGVVSGMPKVIAKGTMMRMLKWRLVMAAKVACVGVLVLAGGVWTIGQVMGQAEPTGVKMRDETTATTTAAEKGEAVTIESAIKISHVFDGDVKEMKLASPRATVNAGQEAVITFGSPAGPTDGEILFSIKPGEAEGNYRPVRIAVTSTATTTFGAWSFSATPYFRGDEPMEIKFSMGDGSPEVVLTVRVKSPLEAGKVK